MLYSKNYLITILFLLHILRICILNSYQMHKNTQNLRVVYLLSWLSKNPLVLKKPLIGLLS